jgi:predicted  nucleic acid-binding Zn-ribbon protein
VQKQLSERAQQIVHIIQPCNQENDILEEQFDSLNNGLLSMESCLETEKVLIDYEVVGAESMMQSRASNVV